MRRRAALILLATLSAGFVPPPIGPKPAPVQRANLVEIVNSGSMYDLINTTDCLVWPSPEVRAKGGTNGWGTWRPKNGDRGLATAWTKHCFQSTRVVFVNVEPYWVPMGESGIKFLTGSIDDLPEITK